MNKPEQYSDEYISAYIDGELDHDERKHVLYAEQSDPALASRINNARMLKEKVQLSYCDIVSPQVLKKPFSCVAFSQRKTVLAASLLICVVLLSLFGYQLSNGEDVNIARQLIKRTPPISVEAISSTVADHRHILINVSQYQPDTFSATIEHIESLLSQHDADKDFRVEIVASGQGVRAFDNDRSAHVDSITTLVTKFDNLDVVVCAKSLASLATAEDPITLIQSIMTTPSVAQQVAKRTGQGWFYLKL